MILSQRMWPRVFKKQEERWVVSKGGQSTQHSAHTTYDMPSLLSPQLYSHPDVELRLFHTRDISPCATHDSRRMAGAEQRYATDVL